MSHAATRKSFHRTGISLTEKLFGAAILAMLAAIALGIALTGRSYDPLRYTGDPAALESTRTAVEGKAATLSGEADLRANELSGARPAGPAAMDIPVLADGLVPMGPTERYDEVTLYEKINGRAPAYFEYNFVELTSRSFAFADGSDEFIDIHLYRMDSPLNAFGIFSSERDPSGTPLEFAPDGYRSGMGFFMRWGRLYVQVLASSTAAAVMDRAEAFTSGLARLLPEDNGGLEGRMLLPAAGQVPGSLTYINDNAYGHAVLKGVFEARYRVDGGELTLFAQACPGPAQARANWGAMRDFHSRYGALEEPFQAGGASVFVAELFGQWSVVSVSGAALAGVVSAPGREAALTFLLARLGDGIATSVETFATSGEVPGDPDAGAAPAEDDYPY